VTGHTRWERAGNRLDIRWLRWLASAGGALATRRNLAGIRQFSATVAGGWLPVKEPVAGTGLGIAGKRQVAGGQVADICPTTPSLVPASISAIQPRSGALPADFFNWGILVILTE